MTLNSDALIEELGGELSFPVDVLEELRYSVRVVIRLLRTNGFDAQADALSDATLLDNPSERNQFLDYLSSGAMWGSAGSVWDAEFPLSGHDRDQVVRDRRTFRATLRRLALCLHDLGLRPDRMRDLADVLDRWRYPEG